MAEGRYSFHLKNIPSLLCHGQMEKKAPLSGRSVKDEEIPNPHKNDKGAVHNPKGDGHHRIHFQMINIGWCLTD